MKKDTCKICGSDTEQEEINPYINVKCEKCGEFNITLTAIEDFLEKNRDKYEHIFPNLSGWLRENQRAKIDSDKLKNFYLFQLLA